MPKTKKLLTFTELATRSLTVKEARTFEVDLLLTDPETGKTFRAYECSVASQDLLFFCYGATFTFVVDNYHGRPVPELHNVELEEDEADNTFTRYEVHLSDGFNLQILNLTIEKEAKALADRLQFFLNTAGAGITVTLQGVRDEYDGEDSTRETRREYLEF